MKKVVFTIKTITPTLMGGGFGQNDGIRPSEIKGMMRYWFRAVAGSVIGDNLEALKDLESKVFGSQERKSPFRIVIEGVKDKYFENWERLPREIAYLGFVINMNRERLNSIIREGSTFNVKFLFRNSIQEKTIKLIAYSFYLATALGGFGLRARRGFGSWQITDVDFGGLDINLSENELKDYKKENIEAIIEKAIQILGNKLNKKKLKFTNFINYKLEQISTNIEDWKDLLSDLGAYYRYFRVNPRNQEELKKYNFQKITKSIDYKNIWKHINEQENNDKNNNQKIKVISLYNPIFGLNIQYSSSKKSFKGTVQLQKIRNGKSETLRRASPMFISIKEIDSELAINLFVSISQYFKDKYLKNKGQIVKIKFTKEECPARIAKIKDFKTITNFMDKLKIAMGKDNAKRTN